MSIIVFFIIIIIIISAILGFYHLFEIEKNQNKFRTRQNQRTKYQI